MDTLVSLRVFSVVAELKSFTAAAARLSMSAAMASKHIAHIESRLGARLLNRTSRSVSLTEVGAAYLEQVRLALQALDETEAAIGNAAGEPCGALRISAPVWMANPIFAQVVADYGTRYPKVQLEIDLSARLVNLVEEGFDLALRATEQPDLRLIARPLTTVKFALVASPAYLARTGEPAEIGELEGRDLLSYTPADGRRALNWSAGRREIKFKSILRSGSESLLRLLALKGMGFTLLPHWFVDDDVKAGRLLRVLPGKAEIKVTIYAVYPSRKYLASPIRTFIDFLVNDPRLK